MAMFKPTLKEPMSQQSKTYEKDFKKGMTTQNAPTMNMNETDGLLSEAEQSLKKKIFSLAKMESLVFADPKLSVVYDDMAENGEEKYGYHYNETIMNMLFNDYILNSPKYLQKYKQAIPKEKKRRDKSGINQLKKAGEKKMGQSGLGALKPTKVDEVGDVIESTTAGSAGGAAGYVGYAGPSAWAKTGDLSGDFNGKKKSTDPKAKPIGKPISTAFALHETNYLTDPSGFEKYVNEGSFNNFDEAKKEAQRISREEGVTQHVNSINDNVFEISDWFDDETTVASFEFGRPLREDVNSLKTENYREDTFNRNHNRQGFASIMKWESNVGDILEDKYNLPNKMVYDILMRETGLLQKYFNSGKSPDDIASVLVVKYGNSNQGQEPNINENYSISNPEPMKQIGWITLPKYKYGGVSVFNIPENDDFGKRSGADYIMASPYENEYKVVSDGDNKYHIEQNPRFWQRYIKIDTETNKLIAMDDSEKFKYLGKFKDVKIDPNNNWSRNSDTYRFWDEIEKLRKSGASFEFNGKPIFNNQNNNDNMSEDLNNDNSKGDLIEYYIPEWAISTLINGDDSGMEDDDINKLNSFIQDVVNEYGNANFIVDDIEGNDNLGFKHRNDIDNLGSNVYRLYIKPSNVSENGLPQHNKKPAFSNTNIKEDTQTMIQNNGTSMSNKAQAVGDQGNGLPMGMQASGGLNEVDLFEEINKELKAFSIHQDKLKVMAEDRKPSALVLRDRVGSENEKNFKSDFKNSDTKKVIDIEKELQWKDQQTNVGDKPQKLGADIEKQAIKTANMKGDEHLKNVGNSTNDKGDEITKRNLTTEEQDEVNLYRNGLHSPIFDNEPDKRYEDRMKADMGDEIYDQRNKQIAFKGKAPMYNKDPQPVEDTTAKKVQFDKEQTGWNERLGINEKSLKESMITGRYIDILGKRRLIEFRLNETMTLKSAAGLFKLDFTGLGNTYLSKTIDKKVVVNETVVKMMETHEFYTDGEVIFNVKNLAQNINENTNVTAKSLLNEEVEKMKHLLGYKPQSYISTQSVKKNRGF